VKKIGGKHPEKHPWDELSVFEVILGMFILGFVIGLIFMLFE